MLAVSTEDLKKIIEESQKPLVQSLNSLLSSNPSKGVVTCPGCKALIDFDEFAGHYAESHPKIVEKPTEKIVEKPVEKIVEKPSPLTPDKLDAVFDHVLKCDEKGCEWVPRFKSESGKKALEKMGYVERGEERTKARKPKSLI